MYSIKQLRQLQKILISKMRVVMRSIRVNPYTLMKPYILETNENRLKPPIVMKKNEYYPLISSSVNFCFGTQKEAISQSERQKKIKLEQLKEIFETKMNKYNLKGLLKMYQILRHNNIPISEQGLRQFNYLLLQQLNSLDHQSTNSILELLYKNGQKYQPKFSNKLLRGINLKLQKGKLTYENDNIYRTIKLLKQMSFPKSTLTKTLFTLVQENDLEKRILFHCKNLDVLKISLIAIETVQVNLEIKKRVLENLLKMKPNGLVELVYYYSVVKLASSKLQETVMYQSQRKSVYQLAFNPYSSMVVQSEESNPTQSKQQTNADQTKQKPSSTDSINPQILKNLIEIKESILSQTFQKIDIKQLSAQISVQLESILKQKDRQIEFKQLKLVGMMLVSNGFSQQIKEQKEILNRLFGIAIEEGVMNVGSPQKLSSKKIVRLPEFVVIMQHLRQSLPIPTLQGYFNKYFALYGSLMNFQEKLIYYYHQSRILAKNSIPLLEIKKQVQSIDYGLNAQEFIWLHKLLQLNKNNNNGKQTIKQIWEIVESKLDREIDTLKDHRTQNASQSQDSREKEEQHQNNQKQSQKKNEDQKPDSQSQSSKKGKASDK